MTRINDVAKIMYDQMTQMGQQPTVNDIARALDAAGHLLPDLPEPTFVTGSTVVWKNDGDEVFLENGEISIASAIRSPERTQRLALAMLAAADYAERNQE
ncbi:hypothetical protein [Corynebacterium sp. AOP12-C2-36]|uniref:hypothetical protein n=1 Tax=Corynebacterium sp. AOP12-C2-36 TaxID=3457723 RepID=UPI004034ABDC